MNKKNEIEADQIEITVSGGFKTENVFNCAGNVLGVLKLKGNKSEGWFRGSDDSELHFERTSSLKFHYQLSDHERVLGKAQPIKALSRKLSLDFDGESLIMAPKGSKARSWSLLDSSGTTLCEIKPRGGFKRGAIIQIFSEVGLPLLVFFYGLVNKRWQEETSASLD